VNQFALDGVHTSMLSNLDESIRPPVASGRLQPSHNDGRGSVSPSAGFSSLKIKSVRILFYAEVF